MTHPYPVPEEYAQAEEFARTAGQPASNEVVAVGDDQSAFTTFRATSAMSEEDKAAVALLRGEAPIQPQFSPAEEAAYAVHHPDRQNAYFQPEITDVVPKREVIVYDWADKPQHELKARLSEVRKAIERNRGERVKAISLMSVARAIPGVQIYAGPAHEHDRLMRERQALEAAIRRRKKDAKQ